MATKPKSSSPPAKPLARAKTRAQPPKPAPERPAASPAAGPSYESLLTKLEAIEKALSELQPLVAQTQALASRLEQLQATLSDQARATAEAKPVAPAKSRRAKAPPLNDDYAFGRDRDPGDAVPPGVAVEQPAPVAGKDKQVLEALKTLPKRRGRRAAK